MPAYTEGSTGASKLIENGSLSTEDFIIGDRVWVNGTKSGYIQYIGETQFSHGDWAGVVLDDPVGKHDGCVGGVRYFQCDPTKGIFVRPYKLTRFPTSPSTNGCKKTKSTSSSPEMKVTKSRVLPSPGKGGSPGNCSITTTTTCGGNGFLRVGDRVVVNSLNGTKTGTLRYLGSTDFATGQWAGVELDEPTGRNDGSVAGKRYFSCKMDFGLFAPVHKVARVARTSTTKVTRVTTLEPVFSPVVRQSLSPDSLNNSFNEKILKI
ncbi:CAP-Gly domain-containing linker protein 2-like isoform X2 [Tachypleus tridentatus]|uniref:CAP-Gly domain-containing linker protein 2-like isoform X2 n=1 Tax=Tachypleus tridentatus TaxID=6853 RepID=UPI003FCF6B68